MVLDRKLDGNFEERQEDGNVLKRTLDLKVKGQNRKGA